MKSSADENISPTAKQSSLRSSEDNVEKLTTDSPSSNPDRPEERSKIKTALILLALCLATFLNALDITIITTALPTIAQDFHSEAGYTWIGSAYLLAVAATTIIWGKASDVFGRKPILLVANVVFFVGSLLSAVSVSMGMLLTARAIQGCGGGGLNVLVNICIGDLFSPRQRGAYYGMISGVWALAMSLGPIIGGAFTQDVSWRWNFYINLPFDGIAFLVILLFLDLKTPRTPLYDGLKAIDWIGGLLSIGGTLMFLLGISFGGEEYAWDSPVVICTLVFGVAAWALCYVWDATWARYPLLSIQIFKRKANLALLGVCFSQSFVYIAAPYYLPLYFQAVLDQTQLLSGVLLLPIAVALSFAAIGTGFYLRHTGHYLPPIYGGFVLQTLGYGLFIDLGPTLNLAKIILFQGVAGLGVGPNFQAPLIALQSHVRPQEIASATSTFAFTRNIAASLGIVIGQVVIQNRLKSQRSRLVAVLGPALADEIGSGSITANTLTIQSLPPQSRQVVHAILADAFKYMWIMYTAFSALGLICCLFAGSKKLTDEHQETEVGLEAERRAREERLQETSTRKMVNKGKV